MLTRVAHVLSHVNPKHAGVPIATRKIGRLQKHYGVDVSFWTTGDEDDRNTLKRMMEFQVMCFGGSFPGDGFMLPNWGKLFLQQACNP